MMRDGDIRLRFLWRKELFDYSELDFFVLNQQSFSRIIKTTELILKYGKKKPLMYQILALCYSPIRESRQASITFH